MRVSLPLRLFFIHLVFTLGAGGVAVLMVRHSFYRYNERWQEKVATVVPAELYGPFANEVARSLLLGLESEYPEVRERNRSLIAGGLKTLLKDLRGIESVVVVDNDLRIQYASEESAEDLTYTRPGDRAFLSAQAPQHRRVEGAPGKAVEEVMIPVFDDRDVSERGGRRRRLGSVLVRYRPDPSLVARVTQGETPSIPPREFTVPVTVFLAAVAAGGVLIAALTGLPVHRLNRALAEFRARDFRGRLDVNQLGLEGKLAVAVQAINELGGRLEALDERGREREVLLQKLSQSLEDGMLAVDPDGAPVAWNPAALRIFGCPTEGTARPGEQGPVAPTEEARIRQALGRNPELLASIGKNPAGATLEIDLSREESASTIPVQVTLVPFEVRPGETGMLLLIRDLATLREIQMHLLEAGRFAVLAHLAAGLAHEIRNPLHSIGLNATVVEQYIGSEATPPRLAAMTESLATIKEETQRLAALLNSYLGLVRPASEATPVDIRDLCRRVAQLLSFAARKSQVEIRLEGEEGLPPVLGEADRLQQAILNLVLNAIQAMPHGGIVRLQTSAAGGLVRVTVSDTGPGVPQELAEHLFDTRVTTKPTGTGLGLPLARIIAEAHGGSIWYRSKAGEGAAFTLVLPSRFVA